MPNKNIFCPSPWLHIKLELDGHYAACRWQTSIDPEIYNMHIKTTSLLEFYNSSIMNKFRQSLLSDSLVPECSSCNYEDTFGKVSGRSRQLLRSNIAINSVEQDFERSHHLSVFNYSKNNNGETPNLLCDLQINLSNVCNGACIMCRPHFSTKLVNDYIKLSKIVPSLFKQPKPMECWADDPILVEKFITDIKELPSIDYVHLLGGETLYLESFYTICDALIEAGISKKIFLGTTTNLTIYTDRLEKMIPEFSKFHIGLSIESINPLNDYIRYPGTINDTLENLSKFLLLREKFPVKLHLSLRVTPNIFTILYFDEVIQYMCDNNITAESCDILLNPACLRIELMPDNLRLQSIDKIKKVIEKNGLVRTTIVDGRNPDLVREVIASEAFIYVDILENMVAPPDVEKHRADLILFLKGFESIRGNSILDYAPEYKSFLESYGYKR